MSNPIMENGNLQSMHFRSMVDLMDFETNNTPNLGEIRSIKAGRIKAQVTDSEWFGSTNRNYEDVERHSLLGDHKLLEITNKHKTSLRGGKIYDVEQKIETVKRKRVKSNFGDELDIHQVYRGALDKAWTRTERNIEKSDHRLVTLLLDIGVPWNVPADKTIWNSAVISKLSDEIQLSGKSVQIIVGATFLNPFSDSNKKATVTVCIKKYNEHLNEERLVSMASAQFFRTIILCGLAYTNYKITPTFGRPSGFDKDALPIQINEEVEAGITIPIILKKSLTEYDARNALSYAFKQMEESVKI